MNKFTERKWKYLSFALMGILATGSVGLLVPQASAHITNNAAHMLEHIYNFVDEIEGKTNNLPSDPASQSAVQTSINDAKDAINAHTDTAIASTPVTITQTQYQTLKCSSGIIRPFVDLGGCFLGNTDLSNSDLHAASLAGAHLEGANLGSSRLWATNLAGAHLFEANLTDSDLEAAILTNADLEAAKITDAVLFRANLSGANLLDANLEGSIVEEADFSGANLDGTNFEGTHTTGAIFTGCTGTPFGVPATGPTPSCP